MLDVWVCEISDLPKRLEFLLGFEMGQACCELVEEILASIFARIDAVTRVPLEAVRAHLRFDAGLESTRPVASVCGKVRKGERHDLRAWGHARNSDQQDRGAQGRAPDYGCSMKSSPVCFGTVVVRPGP